MPVEAVIREIDPPVHEPLGPGEIRFQNLVPLLNRCSSHADLSPRIFGGLHRFAVNTVRPLFQTLPVGGVAKLRRRPYLGLGCSTGINARLIGHVGSFFGALDFMSERGAEVLGFWQRVGEISIKKLGG